MARQGLAVSGWGALAGLLLVTGLLGGCVSTPRYTQMPGEGESTGEGLLNRVSYHIDERAETLTPSCVAILPLSVSDDAASPISFQRRQPSYSQPAADLPMQASYSEPQAEDTTVEAYQQRFEASDKQAMLRDMLYGFVAPHSPRDIELARIDRLLPNGQPPAGRAAQQRLARKLGCDWLLGGEITQFEVDYLGVYSNIRIAMDLQLTQASSGRVLWSGHHLAQSREGGVPLTPIDLAVGVAKAANNLGPDQLEGVAADLARRLVRTMPLEADNAFLVASRRNRLYRVIAKRLNLRAGPGTQFGVRKVLSDADKVALVEADSRDWFRVRTSDGIIGFVSRHYLKLVRGG